MLDAVRVSVRFFCPSCGAGLRAPRADAGCSITCHVCGEEVRAPRHPHPLESELDDTPLISASAAAAARSGCRLLTWSLSVAVAEALLAAALLMTWVVVADPIRDRGEWRSLLLLAGVLHLGVLVLRMGLKRVGYGRCRPAADAVRAAGWIASARTGVVARSIGFAFFCLALAAGSVPGVAPVVVQILSDVGLLVWGVGVVLEFGVVFVWSRLLTEIGGPESARSVGRYLATALAGLVTLAVGIGLAGIVTVMALRRNGPPPPPVDRPPARWNFEVIPPEGWYATGGLLVIAAAFGAVLAWEYYRILAAARAGLTAPTAR